VANYYANVACAHVDRGQRLAALEAVENALIWLPGDAALVYLRAQIHASEENWEASLADYSEVTERLAPNFAAAYARRAEVHRLAANFHEAIDDLDRAIELSPQPDIDLLNERAYVRALAGTDLETALDEIELALEVLSEQDDADSWKLQREAAYLDTRGYIRFRLQEFEAGLGDIERALRILQVDRDRKLQLLTDARKPPGEVMRAYDRIQAEIVYHRGEVRQALGQHRQANDDFALARDLGYTPPEAG
jgi:tetratricopeptide (TPR) repeat protein